MYAITKPHIYLIETNDVKQLVESNQESFQQNTNMEQIYSNQELLNEEFAELDGLIKEAEVDISSRDDLYIMPLKKQKTRRKRKESI